VTWELLLIPSAPGVVVAFLLLAAWLEDRTLAPRPAVVRARPGADGGTRQEGPPRS
jgi:hypothetical protein